MPARITRLTVRLTFCICAGLGTAGCNVDGIGTHRVTSMGAGNPAGQPARTPDDSVDMSIADAREVDLVEAVVSQRAGYKENLEQLRDYYAAHGYAAKHSWAAFELSGLRTVKAFRYLIDAEVPSDLLRANESISEADALYERGLELMRRGGHGVPAIYRQDRMIEAAEVYRELIQKYPSSDKIDDAAFLCGEIHKEYLPGQERIAVRWYERAWTWNPQTPHAARFQAAVVYDYRLHDRDRALELYQAVLKDEVGEKSNVRFATRRIHELTTSDRSARAGRRSS